MGSLEAISRSKQAMRGWKGSLFVLDLSFLGWILLTPFTLGILGLWLNPIWGPLKPISTITWSTARLAPDGGGRAAIRRVRTQLRRPHE